MIKAEVKRNSVPLMFAATETAPGHLAIRGPLSKDPFSEDETAAYSVIAEWIRAQDPESTIVFDIDSPGGDVSGVESLVAQIESRPGVTLAEISGDCASAAYWIASACDKVTAVPSALIGSIGTMMGGGPYGGDDISTSIYSPRKNAEDEQWQEIIDAACERFLSHIAKHRGFEETDFHALARRCGEGKLMTAAEALDRGLIDALIEEGSMNPDEMPEVEREEQSVEETIRDLRMVIEDHEKRIAEMELKLQDLRDDKEDLESEGEDGALDEEKKDEEEEKKDVEAKCQKPSARSNRQISALEARLRAVERARRDDLVLRLMAEGKIKSKTEAEVAKNTYDTNRSLFDRVYGRPAAMSTVSRISSGDAAPPKKGGMTPSQKAFAALASGKYKTFAEAFQAEGGR